MYKCGVHFMIGQISLVNVTSIIAKECDEEEENDDATLNFSVINDHLIMM